MIDNLMSQYPEPVAIVLILSGFVFGGILSRIVIRILHWFNGWVRRSLPAMTLASVRTEIIVQKIVYYLTVGVFVVVALRLLGIAEFKELLDLVIQFIPGLITGASIILVGYLISVFAFEMLRASPWTGESELLPRVVQAAILVMTILTGLSQMSVDVSLIGQTLLVVLVVTLGGLALAFALGSGTYIANVLARRAFGDFAVGDQVRMNDMEGTIVEFRETSVLIQTDQGVAVVPAHIFADSIVIRLTGQDAR